MCCPKIHPSPIPDITRLIEDERAAEEVREDAAEEAEAVVEEEDVGVDIEERLLRSIEQAAIENRRLHDTVRHFQEIIQEQTELLGHHIRMQLETTDINNNISEPREASRSDDQALTQEHTTP